jgi:hypothetical protein
MESLTIRPPSLEEYAALLGKLERLDAELRALQQYCSKEFARSASQERRLQALEQHVRALGATVDRLSAAVQPVQDLHQLLTTDVDAGDTMLGMVRVASSHVRKKAVLRWLAGWIGRGLPANDLIEQ